MLSHLAQSIACFCPVLPFITISRSEENKKNHGFSTSSAIAEVMIVFVLYVFSLLIVQGIADFLLTVLSAEREHRVFGVPCFSSQMSSVFPMKTNKACINRSLYWSGVPRAASCSDINGPMAPIVCKFRWKHCRPYAYKAVLTGTIRECV